MKANTLLAATAIVALAAAGTMVASRSSAAVTPIQTLWNQNSNGNGNGVSSTNFTSGSSASYDTAAADDFVVPAGKTWTVKEVGLSNMCYDGTCNDSYNIALYANAKGLPGKVIKTFSNVSCTTTCPVSAKLTGGTKGKTYWISIVNNNCSFLGGCGQYVWATNTTVHGHQAVWENPGGGYGYCTTWAPLSTCFGGSPADLAFALLGKSS